MTWKKERIYIVVKTYPTISTEYSELVCTAGFREDGSWVRLYPIPFRLLTMDQKYKKYTWIDVEIKRNDKKDFRVESYRPNIETLKIEPFAEKKKVDWEERKKIVFKKEKIYTNLSELIGKAKQENISLAIFKPTRVINFTAAPTEREWDPDKLEALKNNELQMSFFKSPEELEEDFRLVQKIPYKFKYQFEDDEGRKANLMIEDWETGMLYLNTLKDANGDEKIAIEKVKQKYFTEFTKRDLYFFLGTTLSNHKRAPNPFIIIGTFHPPKRPDFEQTSLWD